MIVFDLGAYLASLYIEIPRNYIHISNRTWRVITLFLKVPNYDWKNSFYKIIDIRAEKLLFS